jgi:plasmid stability protein
MPNIQIKDVPDQTHAVLRQRASAAHQSLQEYLRSKLIAEVSQRQSTRCWIGPAVVSAARCG